MKTTKYAIATFILSLSLSVYGGNRFFYGDNTESLTQNGKYTELKEQVEKANRVLPGNIWDGQKLKSLSFDDDNDVVEFTMVKVKPYNFRDCEEKGKTKFGQWILANFMYAKYLCGQGESSQDGEDVVYKNVGKVFDLLKKNWVGIKLRINGRDDRVMTIFLDESQTREAIDKWKDIIDFDRKNKPAFE